jgi:hypothetical protein
LSTWFKQSALLINISAVSKLCSWNFEDDPGSNPATEFGSRKSKEVRTHQEENTFVKAGPPKYFIKLEFLMITKHS